MQIEIERKYLLSSLPDFPKVSGVVEIDQGYLPGVNLVERLRRERWRDGGVKLYRTVKVGTGLQRMEIEDETDERTFTHLWQLTEGRRLTKRRYLIPDGDDMWEVDEFTDRSLFLAELEIEHADRRIEIPGWLSRVLVRDVTEEKQYTNRSLAR